MHPYAQTIVRLYSQLQQSGYSNTEMTIIRNTYELAISLFSCRFQPSGKDFLSHCVGTASILASLGLPAQVVAAGLIHNVYQNGDFGFGGRGISKAKRIYVERFVGKEVEGYAARFATLRWNPQTIKAIRDGINELNPIDRNTVLIRLADHLEHLLDLDLLYYDDIGRRRYLTNNPVMVELAERLGFPRLADEIKQAYTETIQAEIPVRFSPKLGEAFVIPPKSYSKRLSVSLVEGFYRLRSVIKLKRMLRFLASIGGIKTRA